MHTIETINWRYLRVWSETTSNEWKTLGDMADNAARGLDSFNGLILNPDGSIQSWPQYFIAAEGEDPDCDTPLVPVDWTGFADVVNATR